MKYPEKEILARIAAYCAKAERSEYDVRKKLTGWEVEKDLENKLVQRLTKENFLNQERFCKAFIKDKLLFNKWGRIKITFELRKKYIPESIINTCFEELEDGSFNEPLTQLLAAKIKTIRAADEYEKKNKLIRFALGRGYSFDEIEKCLPTIDLHANEDDPE